MKKYFLVLLILPVFVLLISIRPLNALAACDGSLSFTCGPYPNNRLTASWNVDNEWGSCNIFIRGGTKDYVINSGGSCSGLWSSTELGGSPITNDGHYILFVSNGGSCNNQQKGDVTLNCSAGGACTLDPKFQNPDLGTTCTTCIASKMSGAVQWIKDQGHSRCTDQQIVNHMCNGGISSENQASCVSHKNGDCASSCGGSVTPPPPGTKTKIYVDPNPANTGASVTVIATGPTDCSTVIDMKEGGGLSCGLADVLTCNNPNQPNPKDSNACWWRWPCTAGSPGSYKATFNASGTGCASEQAYTVANNNQTPTPTSTPTPVPTTKTVQYRISTLPFSGAGKDAPWQSYTQHPLTVPLDLGNIAPGTKMTVYVQFKSDSGTVAEFSKQITYIGPDPKIENLTCGYDPSGQGTLVTITGVNFGQQKGRVKFNGQEAQVTSWVGSGQGVSPFPSSTASSTAELTPTTQQGSQVCIQVIQPAKNPQTGECKEFPNPCSVPEGWEEVQSCSGLNNVLGVNNLSGKVVAKIRDKLMGNLPIPVELTTADGRTASDTCTIDLTTVSFTAKTECSPAGNLAADNVRVFIQEKSQGAKPVFNEKISLNADGQPVWTPPSLEVGKTYVFGARGPKSLGHKVEFVAEEGTNVLDTFNLLVGDIAPVNALDNRVNSLDFGELKRQWTTVKDVSKTGDFNGDKRINSVDYSCMIKNFNKNGEDF